MTRSQMIETVARDCIGVTVDYILKWFGIPIDMEIGRAHV